ncbi:ABC transporter substrate-binding protein [Deinococcus pimensis]|uniref:ABC transporter substrate-binding protein n=1 Tax=Deinococcus pimensis TaxID=309888 RepID=UPI0004B80122|nr:extracellular solute-binding protein [Deinococcus pimensis]
MRLTRTTLALLTAATTVTTAHAQGSKTITYLTPQLETQGYTKTILDLSRAYSQQHKNVSVKYQNVAQTGLAQQLQLFAASNNLPALFAIDQPSLLAQLQQKGQVVDLEATFKKLGLLDKLNPAAVTLQKKLGGGKLVALPLEMNIEGFWYNKKILADNGIREPRTWDELTAAAAKLQQKGVQPFAASGDQKWPLTRLIGGYVARKYGADAMDRVRAGTLKVTDPGFVEAVTAVADLGKKGYFGQGVSTIDYDTAMNTFLQGKAAMFYMGSWALGNFNDAKQNKIGANNIGFFNFPTVKGGKGTANDWSVNTGLVASVSSKQNDAALQDWMKYVFGNFGNKAFADQGLITGFKVTQQPKNVPALTAMVQKKISGVKNPYLWFEAYFSPKATTIATDNVQPLVTGDLSPQEYLQQLQAALK